MTGAFQLPRKLIILGTVLPLAALLGYLMATPDALTSLAAIALVIGVLTLPIVLNYYHPLLVFSWSASLELAILPGRPQMWMLMSLISFTLVMLGTIMDKETRLLNVPSVTWSLVAMAVVVIVTAKLTGGFGLRAMGGEVYGGRKYLAILLAIIGYFGFSMRRVPVGREHRYAGLFFLSSVTTAVSNLAYMAGRAVPGMWWLFYIFPVGYAMGQAMEDFGWSVNTVKFSRLSGFTLAAPGVMTYMLMRFGLHGLLDFSKAWRGGLFLLLMVLACLGGHRSSVVAIGLLLAAQFVLEGHLRTRLLPVALLSLLLLGGVLVVFVQHLPLSVQRSLSVLPLDVNPIARADAQATSEWRLQMWRALMPEIPKYLFLGKGYTANASDYYLVTESARRYLAKDWEVSVVAGDYHNGPLSIIIPFGIWGVLAFLGFLAAAFRVLRLNFRNGDPAVKNINTLLLAVFLSRLVFFCSVYGAIHTDLPVFLGLIALSVSINGGVARQPHRPPPEPAPATGPAPKVDLRGRWRAVRV